MTNWEKIRKGKTFEEIYGLEKAQQMKEKIKNVHLGKIPWNKGMGFKTKICLKCGKVFSNEKNRSKVFEKIKYCSRKCYLEASIGCVNPNWKGGISESWYKKLMKKAGIDAICVNCKTTGRLHIHHKNNNHRDNRIENLEYRCPLCHKKMHPQVSVWKGKKGEQLHPNMLAAMKKYAPKKGEHRSPRTEFKKGMVPWWKKKGIYQ